MSSRRQFPFHSRGYYICCELADKLLPRWLFIRIFADTALPPRPLPGTPQMWLEAIASKDIVAWNDAATILGGLEEQDRVEPTPFFTALRSANQDVVFWSLVALSRIGSSGKVDEIAMTLKHPAFGVRQAAITTLAGLGMDKDYVQAAILPALDDVDPFVRAQAVRAFEEARILPDHIVTKLQSLRHDPDDDVRDYVERCLEKFE